MNSEFFSSDQAWFNQECVSLRVMNDFKISKAEHRLLCALRRYHHEDRPDFEVKWFFGEWYAERTFDITKRTMFKPQSYSIHTNEGLSDLRYNNKPLY